MKVLIGCERSQVVTNEFRKLGHDAWSCDILPTEGNSEFHIQDDVRKYLHEGWDLGIFFPDCTHICVSGARYFKQKTILQENALDFVARLMISPIPKIAIENPVGVISTRIRKPDQIIQPFEFGHEETKKTCLWLKNLPKLIPTKIMGVTPQRKLILTDENAVRDKNLTASGQNKLTPSKDRAYIRAKTYLGIAEAMAEQWG